MTRATQPIIGRPAVLATATTMSAAQRLRDRLIEAGQATMMKVDLIKRERAQRSRHFSLKSSRMRQTILISSLVAAGLAALSALMVPTATLGIVVMLALLGATLGVLGGSLVGSMSLRPRLQSEVSELNEGEVLVAVFVDDESDSSAVSQTMEELGANNVRETVV